MRKGVVRARNSVLVLRTPFLVSLQQKPLRACSCPGLSSIRYRSDIGTPPVLEPLYRSNQLRRYNCVRRKFDGVDDVPWYSLFIRTMTVGTPSFLSAR